MDILEYKTEYKKPCVMCLGYFDTIHKGHIKIINTAREIANEKGLLVGVLMFIGGKNNSKDVFSFNERLIKLKALNVDFVVFQKLDDQFMSLSYEDFINDLFKFYQIKYFITGKDFTYGKDKKGNLNTLTSQAKQGGAILKTVEEVQFEGQKISTNTIKESLLLGDIKRANILLGSNYFIREKVVKGKQLGKKLGFPTANMLLDKGKLQIKSGVYITATVIDNKLYSCITNVGNQPTVKGENLVIETFVKGFDGDLYDKILSVYFVERIRDIVAFNSLEELKNQLKKDLELI